MNLKVVLEVLLEVLEVVLEVPGVFLGGPRPQDRPKTCQHGLGWVQDGPKTT